jgi:hypothetical protein
MIVATMGSPHERLSQKSVAESPTAAVRVDGIHSTSARLSAWALPPPGPLLWIQDDSGRLKYVRFNTAVRWAFPDEHAPDFTRMEEEFAEPPGDSSRLAVASSNPQNTAVGGTSPDILLRTIPR